MLRIFSHRILISLVIVLFFPLYITGFFRVTFIDRLEDFLYDARLLLSMPSTMDHRIVIADIDEKSLAAEGRWPWGRDRLAKMVDNLFDHYNINTLGFDAVFPEKDESSGIALLSELASGPLAQNKAFLSEYEKLRPMLERDRIFGESLRGRAVVLGYYFRTAHDSSPRSVAGDLPEPSFRLVDPQFTEVPFVSATGFCSNLPHIQQQAAGGGYFDNPLIDPDGVYRRVPLLQQYKGNLYECLALSVTRNALDSPPLELLIAPSKENAVIGLEWLKIGSLRIPVDERGAALIPYRGPQGSFPYISAVDILDKSAPMEKLKGAIVLIGTTTTGLKDLRATPVQNVYPGVEIHANLISGFLDQRIKHRPGYTLGIEFVTLLSIGLLMSFLLPRLSPLWSLIATSIILAGTVGSNFYLWKYADLVVPLAATILLILTLFVLHMCYGYFIEASGKKKIATLFEQYVPPQLVDEMSRKPSSFGLEGESREMTVLFTDIRNFTSMSENMNPRQLTLMMNAIFTPLTEIIHNHRGTIDKYMGDAIMAFWGAPLPEPDHARNGLEAALEMIAAVPELQREFRAKGWPEIKFGIGINSGLMNVGNMGSAFRMTYTVLGDAVNLAARLERLTKEYNADIIVGEDTRQEIPNYLFAELDLVRVQGKEAPVRIFTPIGKSDGVATEKRDELSRYSEALQYYRSRRWSEAEAAFSHLKNRNPEWKLYDMYLNRIAQFRITPPADDWDGVFVY